MNKREFSKNVRIYKSHKLKNGYISITFAWILQRNPVGIVTTVSTQSTVELENQGGALTTLWNYYG